MPTFGSLFAGIGGIDLGLERAGWECVWQVEKDAYCQRVLAKHWPAIPRFSDVRKLSGRDLRRPDLIAGGFPCQPVSNAGRRRAQADERWLWPEFQRIIRLLRPRFVLVENVPGLLVRGMGDVLGGLAALGYDAEWESIPAAAVGAPHLRYRVFVVAYADGLGPGRPAALGSSSLTRLRQAQAGPEPDGSGDGALADSIGVSGQPWRSRDAAEGPRGRDANRGGVGSRMADSEGFPERPRLRESWPDGLGRRRLSDFGSPGDAWAVEPDVGRVAHGVPARVDRLRALGNAVVPQVAEWIGHRLMDAYKQRDVQHG